MRRVILVAIASALMAATQTVWAADKVTVAVSKLSSVSPVFIAKAKNYFDEEGLDVTLLYSLSAQTVGMAVASSDAQFGVTALSAGIYTLAGKGRLKIIAGGYEEAPGFKGLAILISRAAYERGVRTPANLKGLRIGTTATGAPMENQMARVAKKYGFTYFDMTFVPMQTLPNLVSAIKGGQVDATAMPATLSVAVDKSGTAKIIGWMADEVPGPLGGVFASPGMIAQHPDQIVRFLRAYLKGIRTYDRAFQQKGSDGKPIKGENYDETLKILAGFLDQPVAQVELGLPYFHPEARLDAAKLAEQIQIWQSIKQVDQATTLDKVIEPKFLTTATAKR
jgi:NitT/TauT family transport system substrate-binding protein